MTTGWHRTGWVELRPGIGVPVEAVTDGPHVQWGHIDGPLMTWAGVVEWLTWRQRFAIWTHRKTVDEVACEQWPWLADLRSALALSKPTKEGE